MRAQVALEYTMVLALILAALIPIIYLAYAQYDAKNTAALASLAADRLSQAVNLVVAQGPGAATTAYLYWPAGISLVQLTGTEVEVTIEGNPATQVYRVTNANLTPQTFFPNAGRETFNVQYLDNGNVTVSES